jgi:hypothetical protein
MGHQTRLAPSTSLAGRGSIPAVSAGSTDVTSKGGICTATDRSHSAVARLSDSSGSV